HARAVVMSDKVRERLSAGGEPSGARRDASGEALPSRMPAVVGERLAGGEVIRFDDLLHVEPKVSPAALVHHAKADELASLIFTSGTTGRPKGVMLSHRNFASLLSKLAGVFDIDKHDGLLSVLPLHHTFEFTAGLLMPLMRGAQISYLDEVTSENLSAALDEGNVTGMVGVPALWQLLHRRITRQVSEQGPLIERAFDVVVD